MHRFGFLLFAIVLAIVLPAFGQHQSHYAGMETRDIKALSPEQVNGYRTGAGMGFAMAAELNGLPGPKHVIELADDLHLSEEQRRAAEDIYQRMHERAVALGERVVQAEARLDSICARGELAQDPLKSAISRVAELNSELRYTHIVAHFEMNSVLTREQRHAYMKLRGYEMTH